MTGQSKHYSNQNRKSGRSWAILREYSSIKNIEDTVDIPSDMDMRPEVDN